MENMAGETLRMLPSKMILYRYSEERSLLSLDSSFFNETGRSVRRVSCALVAGIRRCGGPTTIQSQPGPSQFRKDRGSVRIKTPSAVIYNGSGGEFLELVDASLGGT